MEAQNVTAIDYEAEYNNRARVPEHPAIVARWLAASSAARTTLSADLDQRYGPGERHRYDLFHAPGAHAPLVVFIHGGYWQSRDKNDFTFIAPALVAKGISVTLPRYTLCPEATVAEIVEEMRLFLRALYAQTGRRPLVTGHSAGGHLAAAMLATDWRVVEGVPPDLVRAAYSLSGLFELAPLMPTSLNAALRLTSETARAASPIFWPPAPKDRTLVAAVGAFESAEFLRQSLDMSEAWSRADVKAECVVVPAANHFTIVDELARPESAMVARIVGLAHACAQG